jgi:hypothetical protein
MGIARLCWCLDWHGNNPILSERCQAALADRRAISLDPNCGWTRGKAGVVYVADAFQVMAKVNALLEAAKA